MNWGNNKKRKSIKQEKNFKKFLTIASDFEESFYKKIFINIDKQKMEKKQLLQSRSKNNCLSRFLMKGAL